MSVNDILYFCFTNLDNSHNVIFIFFFTEDNTYFSISSVILYGFFFVCLRLIFPCFSYLLTHLYNDT